MEDSFSRRYKRYYQSLEPMMEKPKTRLYSTIIFFFMVISLFGWYAIRPTINTIFYLRREIADKTQVNKKMEDKINALIQAQSAYEAIQAKLPLLNEAIPKDPNVFPYLIRMRELAKETGATISATQVSSSPIAIEVLPGENKPSISKPKPIAITFTISGTYPSLKQFFDILSQLRRLGSVDLLTIEQGEAPDQEPKTQITQIQPYLTVTARMHTLYWENK